MMMPPKNYTSGDYSVGTQTFSFVDDGRKEILGSEGGDRRIAVRMYYPISPKDAKGREQAEVYSDRKAKAIWKTFYVKKLDKVFRTAEYFENVPHKVNETFPLILFSHGYNSFIEANTYLCCNLASQGYIVASVGHAYEAVETDYKDGSFDVFDKRIKK